MPFNLSLLPNTASWSVAGSCRTQKLELSLCFQVASHDSQGGIQCAPATIQFLLERSILHCFAVIQEKRNAQQTTYAIATCELVSHVVTSSASIVKCTDSPPLTMPSNTAAKATTCHSDKTQTTTFSCHAHANGFQSWR